MSNRSDRTLSPALAEVSSLFAEGRFAGALAALSRVTELGAEPGRAETRTQAPHLLICQGLLRWVNHQQSQAIAALEQAEVLTPLSPVLYCVLAECHLRQGDRRRARSMLVSLEALEELPDNILGPLARGLYRVGEHVRSLRVCHLTACRYPQADEPLWWMVINFEAQQASQAARLSILLKAHLLAPEEPRYVQELAFLYFERGNLYEAYRYAQAVPLDAQICSQCLGRLQRIFAAAGDGERLGQCHELAVDAAQTPCAATAGFEPEGSLFALEEFPQFLEILDDCLLRSAQCAASSARSS